MARKPAIEPSGGRAAEFEEAEATSTGGLEHPHDQEAKAANTSGTEPLRPPRKRRS